jgi:homospermidine synthase
MLDAEPDQTEIGEQQCVSADNSEHREMVDEVQEPAHCDTPDRSGVDHEHPASPDISVPVRSKANEKADTLNPNLNDLVNEALDAGCATKDQVVWYLGANSVHTFSEKAIADCFHREHKERKLVAEIEQATPAALMHKILSCDSHIAESHQRRNERYRYWQYRRIRLWEALERRGYDPAQELDRLHEERRPKKRKKRKARRNEARQTGLPGL